ncbi:hypothetical protein EJ06DRAFT_547866 [Trichodelitschia bisporula]|uniref:Exonuclease V n=1 Tax=Trichodelitschia bisporula TaxID=703511 RepID=A0A6G1I2U9_9PEZI|nr:hypothetical protein EJ06DRAFT_547866 [Trichodelitschia bisporula]
MGLTSTPSINSDYGSDFDDEGEEIVRNLLSQFSGVEVRSFSANAAEQENSPLGANALSNGNGDTQSVDFAAAFEAGGQTGEPKGAVGPADVYDGGGGEGEDVRGESRGVVQGGSQGLGRGADVENSRTKGNGNGHTTARTEPDIEDAGPRTPLRPRPAVKQEAAKIAIEVKGSGGTKSLLGNILPPPTPPDPNHTPSPAHEAAPPPLHALARPAPTSSSPLARFRAPPRNLSVTDLTSPAWCELQYDYALSRFGKLPRTARMISGTNVHAALEAEVHEFVPVPVQTKVDRWALRLWNVITGLRALRATGRTRELEVWGSVEGVLVVGVIDEVGYSCPDSELQVALAFSGAKLAYPAPGRGRVRLDAFSKGEKEKRRVYVTDVKTRGSKSLPPAPQLKGTQVQLGLYRRFLAQMVNGEFSPEMIWNRVGLDPEEEFSEEFVGGMADKGTEEDLKNGDREEKTGTGEANEYRTLGALWRLVQAEYAAAIGQEGVGLVMEAAYLSAEGEFIGRKVFGYDEEGLLAYVKETMRWWRGERPARGVDIEHAYKCGTCVFVDSCEWIKERAAEDLARVRARKRTAGRAFKG